MTEKPCHERRRRLLYPGLQTHTLVQQPGLLQAQGPETKDKGARSGNRPPSGRRPLVDQSRLEPSLPISIQQELDLVTAKGTNMQHYDMVAKPLQRPSFPPWFAPRGRGSVCPSQPQDLLGSEHPGALVRI